MILFVICMLNLYRFVNVCNILAMLYVAFSIIRALKKVFSNYIIKYIMYKWNMA